VSAQPAPARRPGRPRSEEANEAILDAVIEMLSVHGIKGLTIEAVAARAGVGKTTIYRRWKTKNELIVAAVARVRPDEPPPDSGSLAGDLAAMVALQQRRLRDSSFPRVMPGVLGESMDDPELHAQIVTHAVIPLREMLGEIVRRGIARGELRDDLDVDAVVDVLHALPIYRLLMSGGDMAAVADLPQRVIPLLLGGISSSSAGRASARPRSSGSSRAKPGRSA
jgi:AcrR family transcriptional regulator